MQREINSFELHAQNSELPEGWRWVRLGEVLKEPLKNGLNYSKEDFGTGVRFVNVSDVFCPLVINVTKLDRINVSPRDTEKYRLKTGDILIVRSSLKREGVAYPALFEENDEPVVFCGFLIRIRPDKEKIEPLYLLNYLRASIARERLVGDSDTVTITNVDQGTLLYLDIPLPSPPEQKHIAAKIQELMQEIERARMACEKQLEAAKALPAAYLQEVFESEAAKKWERKRLGEVCISTENRDPRITPDMPFKYVDISSIDNNLKRIIKDSLMLGKDAPSRARQVIKTNDILVATTRPNLNAVAIVPEELNNEICSTGFCVLRPTEHIDPLFLFAFVQSKYFIETISGQVRGMLYPAVTDKQVRDVYIPFPPISFQRRIATELKEKMAHIENLQSTIRNQQSALDALPQTILRKAFSGEL